MITERANIIRQNRRTIKIIIEQNGDINIYAPKHISICEIERLVGNKESWAIKKSQIQKNKTSMLEDVFTYNSAFLFGKKYKIVVGSCKKIGLTEEYIVIPEKYKDKQQLITALKKWYKKLAQEVLVKRAETLKDETGLKYNGIKIGDFRAKWGSCDSNQEIKLNYKLVMLPHNVIDAVILHELVHTKEMSHSRNFYNKLIAVMPEYKKYRAVLKENNYLLKLY